MVTIHPSKIRLLLSCPQSGLGDINISEDSDAARLGRAVHEALSFKLDDDFHYGSISENYNVDYHEMMQLVYSGRKLWKEVLEPICPSPYIEYPMYADIESGISLEGTGDIIQLSDDGGSAIIADWKTDRKPGKTDYMPQLYGYAELVFRNFTYVRECKLILLWLRECSYTIETIKYDSRARRMFLEKLEKSIKTDNPYYSPGDHCQYCGRFYTCPGRQEKNKNAISILTSETLPVVPDKLAELIIMKQQIVKALGNFDNYLKETLENAGGFLELSDGRQIAFSERKSSAIDPVTAWEILEKHLEQEHIAKAVKLSLPKLKNAVAEGSERGKKKKAIESFVTELEESGALTYKKYNVIEIKEGKNDTQGE